MKWSELSKWKRFRLAFHQRKMYFPDFPELNDRWWWNFIPEVWRMRYANAEVDWNED